jgi:hypothetical protein
MYGRAALWFYMDDSAARLASQGLSDPWTLWARNETCKSRAASSCLNLGADSHPYSIDTISAANMHSWRVILACALVALVATASAQDEAQCKKDGEAEGAKVAIELCTSAKVGHGICW